jgi:hypothetical protein
MGATVGARAGAGFARGSIVGPLSAEDLSILALENDTVAGHTCKVILLQDRLDPDALRASIEARVSQAPHLRMRLCDVEGTPSWCLDNGVDIPAHIVDYETSSPLTEAGLREAVASIFVQRLDRTRPLWQIDVIRELADGGSALVWRIHHALADGSTVMKTAAAALWDEPPQAVAVRPGSPEDHRRAHHHLATLRAAARELPQPWHASPFSGCITGERAVAFTEIDLAALHRVTHSAGGATINDGVLTVVAGGIRRWLERCHGHLGSVRVKVPVSLHGRVAPENGGIEPGNRDSFFYLDLPLGSADPLERLAAIRHATRTRKRGHDAEQLDALMQRLADAPGLRRFAERVLTHPRAFAVNVSNVRGPSRPVHILGNRVTAMYPVAEIRERHALRIAAASLADSLFVGFAADPTLVDRVDLLADDVRAEAAELIRQAART